MTKFYGNIGFVGTVDNGHGVYLSVDEKRFYTGDLVRNSKRWQSSSGNVNDDLTLSNEISIVADDFINANSQMIKYVTINGSPVKWKVNTIMMEYPRIRLQIGGVYNE